MTAELNKADRARKEFDDRHIGYEFPSKALRDGAFDEFYAGWKSALAADRAQQAVVALSVKTWQERCVDTGLMPSMDQAMAAMRAEITDLRAQLARQGQGEPVAAGDVDLIRVPAHEADSYCRILSILGMEEEGDPVAEVQRLFDAVADGSEQVPAAQADQKSEFLSEMARSSAIVSTWPKWKQTMYADQVSAAPGQARAAVPDGWKLVPVEPTPEMQEAGFNTPGSHAYNASYRAMLAASPEPATAAVPVVPKHWQLVPKDLSDEMYAELKKVAPRWNAASVWSNLLDAAPDAPPLAAQPVEQPADDARDAARYRVLRQNVAPRDVSIIMMVPLQDIPADQTLAERIDMLCDGFIERQASKGATDGAVEGKS